MATTNDNTVLLPQESSQEALGPIQFNQSNVATPDTGRQPTNENFVQSVGAPEADMHKQVSRWVYVEELKWQSAISQPTLLSTIDTAKMIAAARTFEVNMNFYRLVRASPVLKVVASGNAAQIGQLLIVFLPFGVDEEDFALNWPSIYPHGFLRPNDNTGCQVKGNYVKHFRADDLTLSPPDFGRFQIWIFNELRSPPSTPQIVTVQVYVKFDHVTLRVYRPPKQVTPQQQLEKLLQSLSPAERKAFLATVATQKGKIIFHEGNLKVIDDDLPEENHNTSLKAIEASEPPPPYTEKDETKPSSSPSSSPKTSTFSQKEGLSMMKEGWSAAPGVYRAGRQLLSTLGFKPAKQKGGVMDAIGDVLDFGGKVAGFATKVIPLGSMLFHAPPRPNVNEQSVANTPFPVTRLQYDTNQVCAPDGTVSQIPNFMSLMDVVSFFQTASRINVLNWTDVMQPGTELGRYNATPAQHLQFPVWRTEGLVPPMWRGSVTFMFQVVKNVFHKGQLLIQILPHDELSTLDNSSFGMTHTFDISDQDTFEVTVPWMYNVDFMVPLDPRLFQVVVTVLCALQTTNTVSQVEINAWFKIGGDFQFLGGPSQQWFGLFPTIVTPSEELPATQKSGENIPEKEEGKTDMTEQQTEGTPTETTENIKDFEPSVLGKPAPVQSHGKVTPARDAAWFPVNQSNLKLNAHRVQWISANESPTPYIFGPLKTSDGQAVCVFRALQTDLLRGLQESSSFAFVSGGVRITWVVLGNFITKGTLFCKTFFYTGDGGIYGLSQQPFPICIYLQHTIEIPYMQRTMAVCQNNSQAPPEIEHWIEIWYVNTTTSEDDQVGIMFGIHAADDFAAQQPCYSDGSLTQPYKPFEILGAPTPVSSGKTSQPAPSHSGSEPAKQLSGRDPDLPQQNKQKVAIFGDVLRQAPHDVKTLHDGVTWLHNLTVDKPVPIIHEKETQPPVEQTVASQPKQQFSLLQSGPVLQEPVTPVAPLTPPDTSPPPQDFQSLPNGHKTFSDGFTQRPYKHLPGRHSGCNLRVFFEVDEYVCQTNIPTWTKPKQVSLCQPHKGGPPCYHVHTQHSCIVMHAKPFSTKQSRDRAFAVLTRWCDEQAEKHFHDIEPAPLPYRESQHIIDRKFKHKADPCFTYITRSEGSLFRTKTPLSDISPWGNLPARFKGIWDFVSSPFKSFVDSQVKQAAETFTTSVKQQVGIISSGPSEERTALSTLGTVISSKLTAYVLQIHGASTIADWMSIFLHLFGDIQAAFRSFNIVAFIFDAIKDKLQQFIHLFWAVPPVVPDAALPMAGEDDDGSGPSFFDSCRVNLKAVQQLFEAIGSSIFGMTISCFESFKTACKNASVVGAGMRGVQALINGVKALFEYLGLISNKVKDRLRSVLSFFSRTENQHDLHRMLELLQVPAGNFTRHLAEIRKLRVSAELFLEQMAEIKDPEVTQYRTRCHHFLKHTSIVSSVSVGETTFEPVFLVLEGVEGRGKSVAANKIARSFCKALAREEDDFYCALLEQDYWTGYVDQPVIIFDDLFQDPEGEKVSFLTQLISGIPTPLPQAAIEDKACISSARFIIATTNNADIPPNWARRPDAIKRRFAETHYRIQEDGRFRKVNWTRQPKQGNILTSEEGDFYTLQELINKVWEHYKKKFNVHLSMKDENTAIPLESDSRYAAPPKHLTAVIEDYERPTSCVDGVMKVAYKTKDPHAIRELVLPTAELEDIRSWIGKLNMEKEWDHTLKIPFTLLSMIQQLHVFRFYKFPALVAKYGTQDLEFIESNKTIQSKLSACDETVIREFAIFLHWQGWSDSKIELVMPVKSPTTDILRRCIRQIWDMKKVLAVIGTGLAVLGIAYGLTKLLKNTAAEELGSYNVRAAGQRRPNPKLNYGGTRQSPQPSRQKGLEDRIPIIDKSIVKFTKINQEGHSYSLNAVLLGGGYLLVPLHGICIGEQHFVTMPVNSTDTRDFPIFIDDSNHCVAMHNGKETDLVLISAGTSIPNTRDITNYFISDESLESLPSGPSTVFYKMKGGELQVIETDQEFASARPIINSHGFIQYHDVFQVPFSAKDGTCGSLLATTDPTRDSRIIGLLIAGKEGKTLFHPVSSDFIRHMKQTILDSGCSAVDQPGQPGILDDIVCVEYSEFQDMKAHQCERFKIQPTAEPAIPVHLPLEHAYAGNPPVLLNTSYVETDLSIHDIHYENFMVTPSEQPTDEEALEYGLIESDDEGTDPREIHAAYHVFENSKRPALKSINNVDEPFPLSRELLPGHQFNVSKQMPLVDGNLLLDVLMILHKRLDPHISNCRVLTETEVIKGYVEFHDRRPVENQGFPRNTAIGQTTKAMGFGEKKRDLLDTDGLLLPEVRDYFQSVEEAIRQGKTFTRVITLNLKDELRKSSKLNSGNVRLFCIEDSVMIFLMSKYFGNFVDQFRSAPFTVGHTLGKDPAQIWDQLAKWLGRRVFAGDGKNWDMSLYGAHFELVRRIVEPFYQQHPGYHPDHAIIRQGLLQHAVFSITSFADVNFFSDCMKSGMYATTEFNTLIQMVIILYGAYEYCFGRFLPDHSVNILLQHRFVCNGDDNLHAPLEGCPEPTYADLMKETYAKFGITLTSSAKTASVGFSFLWEVDYLQRSFHLCQGHWYPEISLTTLQGLMFYHRKSTTQKANLIEALTFARQARRADWFRLFHCIYLMLGFDDGVSWTSCQQLYNAPLHDTPLMPPEQYSTLAQIPHTVPNISHLIPKMRSVSFEEELCLVLRAVCYPYHGQVPLKYGHCCGEFGVFQHLLDLLNLPLPDALVNPNVYTRFFAMTYIISRIINHFIDKLRYSGIRYQGMAHLSKEDLLSVRPVIIFAGSDYISENNYFGLVRNSLIPLSFYSALELFGEQVSPLFYDFMHCSVLRSGLDFFGMTTTQTIRTLFDGDGEEPAGTTLISSLMQDYVNAGVEFCRRANRHDHIEFILESNLKHFYYHDYW